MFKCSNCKRNSQLGESENRVVVETRPKQYVNYVRRQSKMLEIKSQGSETIREAVLCKLCSNLEYEIKNKVDE